MHKLVRGIVIAGLAAFAMVLVLAGTAYSQSWDSAINTGLTSVTWSLDGDRYVWTLTNNSSLSADDHADWDILVWDLMPYRIPEPVAWTAPDGWKWDGKSMSLESSAGNYKTPYALGPGQSISFTYQPKINGRYINNSGPTGTGMQFASHVAAVIPGSGTFDGKDRWEEYVVQEWGRTWHDQVRTGYITTPVPEPSGLLALGFGGASFAALLMSHWRRRR